MLCFWLTSLHSSNCWIIAVREKKFPAQTKKSDKMSNSKSYKYYKNWLTAIKIGNNINKDKKNKVHSIFMSAPQCTGFDHLSKVLRLQPGCAEKSPLGRFKSSYLHLFARYHIQTWNIMSLIHEIQKAHNAFIRPTIFLQWFCSEVDEMAKNSVSGSNSEVFKTYKYICNWQNSTIFGVYIKLCLLFEL